MINFFAPLCNLVGLVVAVCLCLAFLLFIYDGGINKLVGCFLGDPVLFMMWVPIIVTAGMLTIGSIWSMFIKD